MQDLIKLIFQNHPEFCNEIKGVSENEIEQLQNLSPIEIPEPYKDFLRIMGKVTGRIKGIYSSESINFDGTINKYENEIFIGYFSLIKAYKTRIKNFFKYNKHKKEATQEAITGSLAEFGENPNNYFLFGIDTRGNDNGDFFLDIRTTNLRVVEICPFTLGVVERSPTIYEFLFHKKFRRETSTFLHNQKWLDK